MRLEGHQLGHYRLLHLIGRGGMGTVYLAEDTRMTRQVAIKVIQTDPYSGPHTTAESNRLFQREMRAMSALDHPRILTFFDFGEESVDQFSLTYIVMPFRPEGSLAEWLLQPDRTDLLSPQDVACLLDQAAEALQHAHERGIIHQDVKPSNFLISSRAERPHLPDLFLADFGIAKLTATNTTSSQNVRGTVAYMPPEQCDGQPVPASDQYALAIMAYQFLTGQLPFQGTSLQIMYQHLTSQPRPPSSLNPRLSSAIDAVILRALAKTPKERFASVTDFARAFQQAIQKSDSHAMLDGTNLEAVTEVDGPLQQVTTPMPVDTPTARVPHSRFSARQRWLMLGLVLVIIVSSIGVSLYTSNLSHIPPTRNVRVTPTVSPTPTATLIVTSVNPYPPNTGTLVLYDPLSDNSRGYKWDNYALSADGLSCQFIGGAYHLTESQPHTHANCFNGLQVDNLTFEVHMQIIKGDCGGITIRDNRRANAYYFRVCQNGSYGFYRYDDFNTPTTVASGYPSAIHTGLNQFNVIALVANGSQFDLYVNHQKVKSLTDAHYSQGSMALAIDGMSEVVYTDVRVWML